MKRLDALKLSKKFFLGLVCAVVTCLFVGTAFATNDLDDGLAMNVSDVSLEASFEVAVDPSEDVVVFDSGDKETLTASAFNDAGPIEAKFQWQILADEDSELWVDIQGETEQTIGLTFGMLSGVLGDGSTAQVRAVATSAEGESAASEALLVTVLPAGGIAEQEGQPVAAFAAPRMANNAAPEEGAGQSSVESRAGTGSDIPDNCEIVISYMLNGAPVAKADGASIAYGEVFEHTFTLPEVQGYSPSVVDQEGVVLDASAGTITLNFAEVVSDVYIEVTFEPTLVDYEVIHYWQNVDDQEYARATSSATYPNPEPRQGLTKDDVDEVARDYPGFYALLYERPEIAADGSTVVEVFYDRNYYLVNFNLGDSAYGVEPVYARYGADLTWVGTPVRPGYTFLGWTLNGEDVVELPSTMPAGNVAYTAMWQPVASAEVTVVFWGENANDERYSYNESLTVNVRPETSFTYDPTVGARVCGVTEEHTHTEACFENCGVAAHTHSLEAGCYGLTCELHNHAAEGCELNCPHVHSLDCYTTSGEFRLDNNHGGVDESDMTSRGNGIYSYTNWIVIIPITSYYLKIGDNWYCSANGATNQISYECSHTVHDDACYTCGKTGTDHVHSLDAGCYELTCTVPVHVHGVDCAASCGKSEHVHSAECSMPVPTELDANKWTFVRSDTVTVKADGSTVVNVYYDRKSFSLNFRVGGSTVRTITEKWGADIREDFPIVGTSGTNYRGAQWTVPSGCSTFKPGTWVMSIDTMPAENITFTRDSADDDAVLYYYVEALSGATGDNLRVYEGVTYQLYKTVYLPNSGRLTESEEFHEIIGYSQGAYYPDTIFNRVSSEMYLYYTRNTYSIKFYNPTREIKTEQGVPFGSNLANYAYTPSPEDAPAIYEPGSVAFEGWYFNPECTGEKFDFDSSTMPAGPNNREGEVALTLYAKWEPVDHIVEFYGSQEDLAAGTKLGATHPDLTVDHGAFVPSSSLPADPTNGNYTFVGWFYMDDGVEKAFDFENMPINKNLQVYAKWSSNALMKYVVYFKNQDSSTSISSPVAIELNGSALAGNTKTFDAKVGNELYADYQEGFFPLVRSHSIRIEIEEETNEWYAVDSETGEKVQGYTFWYVQKPAVPYMVRYVDQDGNPIVDENGNPYVQEKVVLENSKSVVTETFEVIPGYRPDAYQKRLIVTGEDANESNGINVGTATAPVYVHEDNVVEFVYVKDDTHAYYKVTHFTESADGTGWTEYKSAQTVGNIGDRYTAEPLSLHGFEYVRTEYVADGEPVPAESITAEGAELTSEGLEINLYYERVDYPYVVRYLQYGTGIELAELKESTAPYGRTIAETAVTVTDYAPMEPAKLLTIKVEEGTTPKYNIITFYYVENDIPINYEVVGPDGSGALSLASETVKVTNGVAAGSTPTAAEGYRFAGWFTDEACTTPVDASWVDANGKLAPARVAGTDGVPRNIEATYYAKFERALTSIEITKEVSGGLADANQSFVFDVMQGDAVVATVVIHGAGSVTVDGLVVGETYTVVEDGSWSWRYTADSLSKDVTVVDPASAGDTGNKVAFANTLTNDKWLTFSDWCTNLFKNGLIQIEPETESQGV